jgi:ATP-dependent RNA helicase DeaD
MALLKNKGSFGSAEIWSLFRSAGYIKPTHLQQRVVPLIMRGRDVAVEAEGDSGKTAAFILPILVRIKRGKAGIKAVVLTSSIENSRKVYREFRRFSGSSKKPSFFALGVEGLGRKEHSILARSPDVIIGTPNRVIDHIRRGNLDFSSLQIAVVDRSGDLEQHGFVEDVLFIHSKFPPQVQTLLIAPSLGEEMQPLVAQLKRPAVIPLSSWKDNAIQTEHRFIEVHPRGKEAALQRLVLVSDIDGLLIQCRDAGQVRKVAKLLRGHQFKTLVLLDDLSPAQANKASQSFSVGAVSILVSTFSAIRKRSLKWVSQVINLDLPPEAESYRPRSFVLKKVTTLGSAEDFQRLQEIIDVDVNKKNLPPQEDVLDGSIRQILDRIRQEEDPEELEEYRRIIRRRVPMRLRGYFMAYLFKIQGGPALKKAPEPRQQRGQEFSKLFVSVGRSRRVYPKDLVELFMSRLGLDRSQIREVKVLESYSFIEVDSSAAEKAIAELSGTEFKGRKLAVNHARKKEGG